jgi:hypothetical protein
MDPRLFIDLPRSVYLPGETISGKIFWVLERPPEELRLTLGWWTEGRGTKDSRIEKSREWRPSSSAGEEPFELTLPPSPYSFSGTLIALKWALELRAKKEKEAVTEPIVVSPDGEPIELPHIDEGGSKPFSLFGNR